MYKNIEILDKEKSKKLKFDNVDTTQIAKNVGLIPLGFSEVWYASHSSVVIISSGEDAEFLAFTGISSEISIFNKSDVYLPAFIRSYPFLNVQVKDDKEQLNSVIAIDKNSDFVGENKAYNIINEDKSLSKEASIKIELVRELSHQRDVSKKIISELKSKDLLVKKDLRVNINNEEKTILKDFYVIDIDKLIKLDDKIISIWARKGWMSIFDAHLKSISNFEKILKSNLK